MAKRIGIFLDVSNLYYCVGKRYDRRKLDYRKYYEFVDGLGSIQVAQAYGTQLGDEAKGFIHCLKRIGFTPKFKDVKSYSNDDSTFRRKADWDVGITVDIVNMVDRLDMVILGSADGDLEPIVDWCMRRGVDVVVLACGISRDLKQSATKFIEIPESFLEDEESKRRRQEEANASSDDA